jgi:DNA-directed RNA polymerase II subunit RPB1
MVIPRGINIHRSPNPKSSNPVFDDGMMIEKKTAGVHEKVSDATRLLFTGIQMVINFWLFHNGFCIGLGDTIADQKTVAYITQHIAERKQNVADITEDAYHDRLKATPGMTLHESFESASSIWLVILLDITLRKT